MVCSYRIRLSDMGLKGLRPVAEVLLLLKLFLLHKMKSSLHS
jgi:hypothetical protein